jgi:tetratricopeptide (TPR) repeat protein
LAVNADLLTTGWHFHQAGDLPRAEQVYRQLVEQEPENARGWYLLGTLCQTQLRRLGDATASYRRALQLRPGYVEAQHGLACVLRDQRCFVEAVETCQQALELCPDSAEAHYLLGTVRAAEGSTEEAMASYQQALRFRPDMAEAHHNLGVALLGLDQPTEAINSLQHAVQLKPELASAHVSLGLALRRCQRLEEAAVSLREAIRLDPNLVEAFVNLGHVLGQQGQVEEAQTLYAEAQRLQPDYVQNQWNLGGVLRAQGRLKEALAAFHTVILLKPGHSGAHLQLGTVYQLQGRLEEALAAYRQALELQPGFAEAHLALGTVYHQQGRLEEALAADRRAMQLKPDYARAHYNSALAWLPLGNFEEGWAEFEWRWQVPNFPYAPPRIVSKPRWDGSLLSGRTILLQTELGLGDAIHFARYARLLKAQGATVIVQCQRPLLRLLACCPGIDHIVARGDPLPPFDVWSGLMSLPYHFKTSLDTVPAEVPYLWADDALVEHWRQELAVLSGFKIGIAWRGGPDADGQQRCIPLTAFAPLAALPGVRLVSVQKGPGTEQVSPLAGHWPLTDLSGRLDEASGPFMDTAALMKSLDLVVTADTSIPHLAGALGVPVWVALPKVSDWRWMLEREDSPWYPTMRLFRQERTDEWGPVFERIAEAVRQRMASTSSR